MENIIAWPIFNQEKHNSIYKTTIYILSKMGDNFVTIVHIYGAKKTFLLFCICQDTGHVYKET